MSAACSVVGIRTEENPRFQQVLADGNREIRLYNGYIAAETVVEGEMDQAQNEAFRILAGYIFGKNQANSSIPMTAPVTVTPESKKIPMTAPVTVAQSGSGWRMRFMMPSAFTHETLPRPLDERIKIVDVEAERVAVLRFTFGWDAEKVERLSKELSDWVREKTPYEPSGPARVAGYDPPWTIPFLRKNEILLPVTEKKTR